MKIFFNAKSAKNAKKEVKFLFIFFAFFALFAFINFSAYAITAAEKIDDPTLQTRALSLYREIRCVVCQGQSIDGSNSEMAAALRAEVRRRLNKGDDDRAIVAALRHDYGDAVLMTPPWRPSTGLLWFMPVLLVVSGGVLTLRTLRGRA